MWDDFCSTHQVGAFGQPIFETEGDTLTVQTYDKNKRTMPEKFEIKKFDPVVRKHVMYKEAKIK